MMMMMMMMMMVNVTWNITRTPLHCLSPSAPPLPPPPPLRLPTYILSECVLVYLEPGTSTKVVGWLGAHFRNAAMVVYEQVGSAGWGMGGRHAGFRTLD